jgi:hypothetical protein
MGYISVETETACLGFRLIKGKISVFPGIFRAVSFIARRMCGQTQKGGFSMKKHFGLWYSTIIVGIIALVGVIGFSMTACDDGNGNKGKLTTMKWTAVGNSTFGTTEIIHAITYGDGKFVAGGEYGKLAYSTDGTSWTAATNNTFGSGFNSTILSIAYGASKFVAVGEYGKMAFSSDGASWTAVTNNTFTQGNGGEICVVIYDGDKFVAGGRKVGPISADSRIVNIATSTDGENWTAATINDANTRINAIAYNGTDKFVAGSGDRGRLYSSADGTNWTNLAESASTFANDTSAASYINAIIYENSKFIAVGGRGKMATSADGATWTAVANTYFSTQNGTYPPIIYGIAYGNGQFVAVGELANIAYSADGTTWTKAESTFPTSTTGGDNAIRAVAWGGGKFVAVGHQGKMAWSTGNIE